MRYDFKNNNIVACVHIYIYIYCMYYIYIHSKHTHTHTLKATLKSQRTPAIIRIISIIRIFFLSAWKYYFYSYINSNFLKSWNYLYCINYVVQRLFIYLAISLHNKNASRFTMTGFGSYKITFFNHTNQSKSCSTSARRTYTRLRHVIRT